jgi:hypothetical protein
VTELEHDGREARDAEPTLRVFVSYSRADAEKARWLRTQLENGGVTVFRDIDDTVAGEEWWRRLTHLITLADAVVFLLSPHSLASKVCADEVAFAQSLNKRLFPASIEAVDWSAVPELGKYHAVKKILPRLGEPVRYAAPLDASLPVLIESVKAQGLEGLVAKRLDSRYEAGLRSGAWQKMRVNRGQEFVIGGYTVGTKTFDALVFGYYEGDRLIYAARTRNGFTPVVREQLF